MTLGREDLLTTRGRVRKPRSHANTEFANGYISYAGSSVQVVKVVLYYGEIRLKGYAKLEDVITMLEHKLSTANVSASYPKR